MFTTARIKLTIWYLLIIMLVSIMFSLTIFRILGSELDHAAQRLNERYTREFGIVPPVGSSLIEPEVIQASEQRIAFSLVYVNLIILIVAGAGGYVLAGITLKPIQDMILEQNRFVADASHELKTPITSLRSEIEVYLRQKHHTLSEAESLIKSNLEEASALQILSDSLLALATPNKLPHVAFSTHALETIVSGAIKNIQKQAKQKDIVITTHIGKESVIGNSEQLTNVFSILLDNAIKYSQPHTKVSIATSRKDQTLCIQIEDEGIGIPEKDLPHIFDRFYRADISRTKQQIPGFGLGLSIAKQIVSDHNGSIQVKSKVGSGTTFTLQLPTS